MKNRSSRLGRITYTVSAVAIAIGFYSSAARAGDHLHHKQKYTVVTGYIVQPQAQTVMVVPTNPGASSQSGISTAASVPSMAAALLPQSTAAQVQVPVMYVAQAPSAPSLASLSSLSSLPAASMPSVANIASVQPVSYVPVSTISSIPMSLASVPTVSVTSATVVPAATVQPAATSLVPVQILLPKHHCSLFRCW